MKFKKLNEDLIEDELYPNLVDYVYDTLVSSLDNIAISAASDLNNYNADYAAEELTAYTAKMHAALKKAAQYCAEDLLYNAL